MTHLYIELNTGLTEEVDNKVIEKLYDTVTNNTLDETSDLKGRLHSTVGYRYLVNHLNTTYSDLHISVDEYAISFEDPNMLQHLLDLGIGSNGYITEAQAAAATTVANSTNATITKFNELKYFTSITSSRGGFSGTNEGVCRFFNWTALLEVDISNFTSLGHSNGASYGDTFVGCSSLKKVVASDKLTLLGFNSFNNCSNLETITGLSGTIEVWDNAFNKCSKLPQSFFQPLSFLIKYCADNLGLNFLNCTLLTSIDIADGTTTIPPRCFLGCSNLTTVTIPNSVTNIKTNAFTSCSSLTTLTVPTAITSIGNYVFLGCTNLTTVTGMSELTIIPIQTFVSCTHLTSVDIDWTKITSIGKSAFDGTTSFAQENISISNLTSIGEKAFLNSGIKSIISLGNISSLASGAFYHCTSLNSVMLPNTLLSIYTNVFSLCTNLQTINIPSSVVSIYGSAFRGCSSLSSTFDLGNITNDIDSHTFRDCPNLTISNFPRCSRYNEACFSNIRNTSITIPNTVTTLSNGIFSYCNNLTTVNFELNSQIESIGGGCFRNTRISSIVLPEGLTTIGNQAFRDCLSLTTVEIPSTVTSMESELFNSCGSLTSVIIKATTPSNNTNIFLGIPKSANYTIYVPAASVSAYQSAWTYVASRIQAIST